MKQGNTGSSRRDFLVGAAGAGVLATGGSQAALAMADLVPHSPDDERFWSTIRSQFALRPGLIHLNSANLSSTWRAALAKADELAHDVIADPSFENRLKFEDGAKTTRAALAAMLGASPEEIAIVRNTSEANRTVIAGLDLGPGDEVVIWDQNHESNSLAWDVWAQRRGFKVVRVATPTNPANPADLITPFTDAFNGRTKVVAFSHVSNVSGVALPARQLCEAAAKRNILSLIDGAQTFGVLQVDLHDLQCDFYSGSAHKWLGGPHETGVLYVRASRISGLWPSMVTHAWETMSVEGARKFECLGQRQEGRIDALGVAVGMRMSLGQQAAERRVRYLVRQLREKLVATGKPLTFISPESAELNAGILMFSIKGGDPRKVMEHFYTGYGISAVAYPRNELTVIRFSPNIYTTMDDIGVAASAINSLAV